MVKTHQTQGPWVVKHSESKSAWNIVGTLLRGKHKIARIPYVFIGEAEMAPHNEKMRNEAKADATLIAAAPMILAACKQMLTILSSIDFSELPEDYDEIPFHEWEQTIKQATTL